MDERHATAGEWTPVGVPVWVRTGYALGTATAVLVGGWLAYAVARGAVATPQGNDIWLIAMIPLGAGWAVAYAINRPRAARVRPIPGGVRLDRGGAVRDIPFVAVRRMTVATVTPTADLSAFRHSRLDLQVDGVAGTLTLHGPPRPLGEADRLDWLTADVQAAMTAAALQALPHGDALAGDGWVLADDCLTVRHPHLDLPLADIGSFDLAEADLCVWRTGERRPAVRIPVAGPNTAVLHEVLRRRVPLDAAGATVAGEFGRVLYERPSEVRGLAVMAAVAAAALGGVFACAGLWGVAVVGGAAAVAALVVVARAWRAGWTFSERGAEQRGLDGTGRLLYGDIGTVTLRRTDPDLTGWDRRATAVEFVIAPEGGRPGSRIRFAASGSPSYAIVPICKRVSRVVAERLRETLNIAGAAYWADGLLFEPGGLRVRAAVLPYQDITGTKLVGNTLTIRGVGRKPVEVATDLPNFWPGYVLLQQLIADSARRPGTGPNH